MFIEVIELQCLYWQISDQLCKLIVDGEFVVGLCLLFECELLVQLGVSCLLLCEVFIVFEVEGYIEVCMGLGIYVCVLFMQCELWYDLFGEEGLLELICVCEMIEGEVVYVVVQYGSKQQIVVVEEVYVFMIVYVEVGIDLLEVDCFFYICLVEVIGNSVLVGLVMQLFDVCLGLLFECLYSYFDGICVWQEVIEEYGFIMQVLCECNFEQVCVVMWCYMDIVFMCYSVNLIWEYGNCQQQESVLCKWFVCKILFQLKQFS